MKQLRSRLGAVALALLVVIAAFAFALPSSAQDSSATEIDSCTTITEPGEYVLTDDIENSNADTCIEIQASDVTLDGDGHTIDGVDADDTIGIEAVAFSGENVTVQDVTVTDWNIGVFYDSGAADGTVSGVTATSNQLLGIGFNDGTDGATVTDSTVSNNEGSGIDFFASDDNTVADVTVNDNRLDGISFADSGRNVVRDVTANDNSRTGFAFDEAFDTTMTDAVANGNERGFDLSVSLNVTIEDATAKNNAEWAYRSNEFVFDSPLARNSASNFALDSATISFTEENVALAGVQNPPADPDDRTNIGQYVTVADGDDSESSALLLNVHYDDMDAQQANVDEDSLRLYAFTDDEWTELPDSSVDTDANVVSAEFDDPAAFGDGTVLAPFGQADGDGAGDGSDNGDGSAGDGDDNDADDGDSSDGGDGADGGDSIDDGDIVDIGAKDITINLGDVTIADFDLNGPGLSDEHIDERTYSVGDFEIEFAGIDLTIGDTDYRVCKITISVEPFDVILENVTLGNDR